MLAHNPNEYFKYPYIKSRDFEGTATTSNILHLFPTILVFFSTIVEYFKIFSSFVY